MRYPIPFLTLLLSIVASHGQPILSISRTNDLRLDVQGAPRKAYALEVATNLSAIEWDRFTNAVSDASGVARFGETIANDSNRFFRAVALPPLQTTTTNAVGDEDDSFSIALDGFDPNEESALHAEVIGLPSLGNLFQFDGKPISSAPALVTDSQRRVRFLAPQHENGTNFTQFTYQLVRANDDVTSYPADVTVSVLPVPDPPIAFVAALNTDEDVPLLYQLSVDDPDLSREGDELSYKIFYAPVRGQLFQVAADDITPGELIVDGDFVSNTNGYVYFVPPPNANAIPFETLTVRAHDRYGLASPLIEVPINVAPVNDPPLNGGFPVIFIASSAAHRQVQIYVQDPEDNVETVCFTSFPERGSLYYQSISPENLVSPTNNCFPNRATYVFQRQEPCNFIDDFGTNYASFSWIGTDAGGLTATGASIVDIEKPYGPPGLITPTSFVGLENSTNIPVLVGVTNFDGAYTGVMRLLALPTNGSLYLGDNPFQIVPVNIPKPPSLEYATLRYVPNPGFVGTDSIELTFQNQYRSSCEPTNITIEVLPINHPPSFSGQEAVMIELDQNGNVLSNAVINNIVVSDPDAGTNLVSVSIQALRDNLPASGAFIPASTTGLSVLQSNSTLFLKGSLADINAAFAAGIQYQPDHGDTSATSILLTANDNGHTGEGSAQETTRLLNVVFGQILED